MSVIQETAISILRDVVDRVGGQRKAALILGVSDATLCNWLGGKRVSQMEIMFSALEKAGARLICDGHPLPEQASSSTNIMEEKVRLLEMQIASKNEQIELLKYVIEQLKERNASSPGGLKKDAG